MDEQTRKRLVSVRAALDSHGYVGRHKNGDHADDAVRLIHDLMFYLSHQGDDPYFLVELAINRFAAEEEDL